MNNGVAKHHLTSSFPQRWRRSQRCWEYPSKHRCDRCKRRALLDYFNHRCFYHHVGQPDTPSGVLAFVFVLHLMFFQQAAGIHIQMLGKAIHCHIQPKGFGKLCGATFPFAVLVRYNLRYRPALGPEVASKAHSLHGRGAIPNAPGLCLDTAADPADPVHLFPVWPFHRFVFLSA